MQFRTLKLFSGIVLLSSCSLLQAKSLTVADPSGKPVVNAVVSVDSAQTPPPGTAVMDQIDRQFVPEVLAVPVGTSVAFPNSDNIRHHVYSFSQAKPFEIKLYAGTAAEPVTFDKTGIVALGCNIHDKMIGYIYVYDKSLVYVTDKNGQVEVPDTASAVTLWHPNLDIVQSKRETMSLNANEQAETLILTLRGVIPAEDEKKSRTFGSKKFGSD